MRTIPGVPGAPFEYVDAESVGMDGATLAALADVTALWVAQDRIVGAEIVVLKKRKVVLHEAIGWSDREAGVAMRRDSFFRIRSMTKPFTGTAMLLLIEDGAVGFDSRVSEFLPSWDSDRTRDITVLQALAHQSGFVDGDWSIAPGDAGSLRELADGCGEHGPSHPADGQFRYSDVNTYALGAIVAEVSGMPLERFIESRLLGPIGLDETHVGYTPDAPWATRMIPTYERDESEAWIKYWMPEAQGVFPYFRASGGLVSTAFDYAKWLHFWMDEIEDDSAGMAGLSPAIAREAARAHGADEIGGYGLHWEIHGDDPLVFGHAGSDGTIGIAVPSEDLVILYFTQSRRNGTVFEWLDQARSLGIVPGAGVGSE